MANKIFAQMALLLAFFCVLSVPKIYAQETKKNFLQKLEWKSQSNAYEYKVEIRNVLSQVQQIKTKNNYITISLPSGNYEWRIIAYDFLGREATKTRWNNFEIKKALEPQIELKSKKIELGKNTEFSIPVQIQNVSPGIAIELIDVQEDVAVMLGTQKGETVVFKRVPEGNYKVRVTNPGGLFNETEVIEITGKASKEIVQKTPKEKTVKTKQKREEKTVAKTEPKKEEKTVAKTEQKEKSPKDIFIMVGWEWLLGFVDKEILGDNNAVFGPGLKLEFLPIKINKSKLGFNLQAFFFPASGGDAYVNKKVFSIPLALNLCFYFPIASEKIYFGLQAGGGLSPMGFYKEESYPFILGEFRTEYTSEFLVGYLFDAGIVFRFILEESCAIDFTGRFTDFCADSANMPGMALGIMAGIRL